MRPRYRFTLDNATVGSKVISEPIGWKKIELNLERHPDYHSLVENFEIPLEFYGTNGVKDGGYDYIKSVLDLGLKEKISILIEIQPNVNDSFETLFNGNLQLQSKVDITSRAKMQVPIIRNDLWAKFINRRSTPVNLNRTTSLDGGALTARPNYTLALPGQTIRQQYDGRHFDNVDYATTTTGGFIYGIIDFENTVISEIKEKYDYPRIATNSRPFELFAVEYDGEYQFDSSISLTTDTVGWNFPVNSQIYFQINDDAPILFTEADLGAPGVDGRTRYTYSDNHSLLKGDLIRIYISSADPCSWVGGSDTNFLTVVGDTVYLDTTTDAYLLHDAALSICDRIIGRDESFYSEYFGGASTQIVYPENGCGYGHILMKGQHVRGYTMAEKPFEISFNDWWEGANPIFSLGLGYEFLESSPDAEVIRIEKKSAFFDDSVNSVELTNVLGVEISYDPELLLKNIKIGYQKWAAESGSGIDDPQTVHEYFNRLEVAGKDTEVLSSFYAASLGIEHARRKTKQKGEDYKLDEDNVIIQVDPDDVEEVRLYDPANVSNLLHSGTRYNVRMTPATNFYRWFEFFQNTQKTANFDDWYFGKGEGNVLMAVAGLASDPCSLDIGGSVAENQDFQFPAANNSHLFQAIIYSFTHPLTYAQYKAIYSGRKNSIGMTWTDRRGVQRVATLFIKKMGYLINESKARFECWLKSERSVQVEIQMNLFEDVGGANWQTQWNDGVTSPPETLNITDDGASASAVIPMGSRRMTVGVAKGSNLGVTEAAGTIIWYKNGSEVESMGFPDAETITSFLQYSYTYENVVDSDVLKVEVYEGVTP